MTELQALPVPQFALTEDGGMNLPVTVVCGAAMVAVAEARALHLVEDTPSTRAAYEGAALVLAAMTEELTALYEAARRGQTALRASS